MLYDEMFNKCDAMFFTAMSTLAKVFNVPLIKVMPYTYEIQPNTSFYMDISVFVFDDYLKDKLSCKITGFR